MVRSLFAQSNHATSSQLEEPAIDLKGAISGEWQLVILAVEQYR